MAFRYKQNTNIVYQNTNRKTFRNNKQVFRVTNGMKS